MANCPLAISCLIYGLIAVPTGSHSQWNSPCLAENTNDPVKPKGVLSETANILRRIEGVEKSAAKIKEYIIKEFNYNTVTVDELNLLHFTDTDKYTVTTERVEAAKTNPAQAVQSHYALMFELVAHIDKCRNGRKIKEMTGEDTLKKRLLDIEKEVNDIICSIEITLRGEGISTDHSVTEEVLSAFFLNLNSTLAYETYRAYIEMNDIEGVMGYIKEILTTFQSSQTV